MQLRHRADGDVVVDMDLANNGAVATVVWLWDSEGDGESICLGLWVPAV